MEHQGVVSRKTGVEDARGPSRAKEELRMKNYKIEKEQPVSWSSGIYHQPYLNLGILYIMGFKTPINPDLIKSGLQETLFGHHTLSSLQVVDNKITGKMKLVPTELDMERHVIVPSLDINTDNPDKLVEDYMSSLRETKFDYSKPLWEYHILNIKTSEAEATGVFWIHHSIGDGSSLTSLLLAISRKASDPNSLPSLPQKKKEKQAGNHGSYFGFIGRYLVKLWSMVVLLWNTIVDVGSFVETLLILKDADTLLRRLPDTEYAPRRFVHRTVSFHDVKLIKNAMNATVSDVVLGITQAALSRYVHRRRYDENTRMEKEKITSLRKSCLKAAVMVDIRPTPGVQALSGLMEKKSKGKWGNFIGFIFLPLNIQKLIDPLAYIRQAKTALDQKKNTLESTITYYAARLIGNLFGTKAASVAYHRFWSQTSLTFSSVAGPLEEITFFDHPVAYLVPTLYGTPQALIVHLHSYADKITLGISVDERIIPNPHKLCDDFVESLKLMKEACLYGLK